MSKQIRRGVTFASLPLQPSQASLGSAAKDIDADWSLLVVKAYQVKGIHSRPPANGATADRIPTGNTPQLFTGSVSWLPSGSGLAIPNPGIMRGKPVGLWWRSEVEARNFLNHSCTFFLTEEFVRCTRGWAGRSCLTWRDRSVRRETRLTRAEVTSRVERPFSGHLL